MWNYGFLLAFLSVATVTDIRRHKIYNWNTYTGMVAGLLVRTTAEGLRGLEDALLGWLVCGFVMLLCFVLFNVGGGDVKLIAMMGAFLGLQKGIEAMLWTFVLGAVMGMALIIWRFGFWFLLKSAVRHLRLVLRARGWVPLTEEERRPLQRWLYLAPSALVSVLLLAVDEHYGFLEQWFR